MSQDLVSTIQKIRSKNKIFIWGNGCAGKSTFASVLSKTLPHQLIHIDDLRWAPGWIEKDKAQVTQALQEKIQQQQWIIEDGSIRWTELLIQRSDMVIWLDPPVAGCFFRVIKRSFNRWLFGAKSRRGREPVLASIIHWRWVLKYYWQRKPIFAQQIANNNQLIYLSNWKEIKKMLTILAQIQPPLLKSVNQ